MGKAVQEIQLESQSWYAKAAAVVEERLERNKRTLRKTGKTGPAFLGYLMGQNRWMWCTDTQKVG